MKMKYILVIIMSFVFGQEKTPLDFGYELQEECFQILIEFQDGWVDNMLNLKDTILCPNMIDVRIEYEGKTTDYTMDEFLKRLGLKE